MSSYNAMAINPMTKEKENAFFIDDYYGKHMYGVKFSDGKVYPVEEIKVETEDEKT